jgi:RNA polymerase sigma-70 factor (ECF subfamily)
MSFSSALPATPAVARSQPPVSDRPDLELAYVTNDETAVDAPGFDAFYRSKRPLIVQALALSLGDADVAADATDEAMTRAYERWKSVGALERPEGWVYRVASNWALSIFRRRRRSLHRLYDPSVADATRSVDPAVHRAVAALDVKQRSVVVCRHLLGWSVAETATALGISEGTVKSRLHRATTILRTQLRDLHSPEEQS